jgi:hypothetical protein
MLHVTCSKENVTSQVWKEVSELDHFVIHLRMHSLMHEGQW